MSVGEQRGRGGFRPLTEVKKREKSRQKESLLSFLLITWFYPIENSCWTEEWKKENPFFESSQLSIDGD